MLKDCFNTSMHSQAGAWERGKTSSIDISIDEENKNSINQFIPIVQNNI